MIDCNGSNLCFEAVNMTGRFGSLFPVHTPIPNDWLGSIVAGQATRLEDLLCGLDLQPYKIIVQAPQVSLRSRLKIGQ